MKITEEVVTTTQIYRLLPGEVEELTLVEETVVVTEVYQKVKK